jgi:toxin ParE1/3/4
VSYRVAKLKYRITRRAISDLTGIAAYLRAQSPSGARRVIRSLYQTFSEAARNPDLGTARDDLRQGLRAITPARPAHNYVVLTSAVTNSIEVIAVVHGARDWENLVADED